MSRVALWLPFEVADLDRAAGFYTDQVGLPVVDGWDRDGERGVVLGAGAAFVELVSPGRSGQGRSGPAPLPFQLAASERSGPAPLAFQLADAASVDGAHARFGGARPRRYPRGHYGFETDGPAGTRVMIWSERE
ncbi:MAG: hypothetical protein GEV28_07950 [Actinophytocola sp.]|uniref:VOC family protein n=1 Tax=Actinophytocola sp. TaxID=1872138 RepID=UPI001320EC5E|nr:VOC family protein [Actinophytocola sp.]MPZ80319.1 hypothetical protein [Actinophytocola sp.]